MTKTTQITFGSDAGMGHFHSYYDISVLRGDHVLAVRTGLRDRHPTPEDTLEVGLVDSRSPGSWEPVGRSAAWSWQQGPMAQFVPGTKDIVFNDREGGTIVARRVGATSVQLPRPVYAIDPTGAFGLALDMGRLDSLRPGYGYATQGADLTPVPDTAGVERMDLMTGQTRLILSVAEAVRFLLPLLPLKDRVRHKVKRFTYWFNHAKISPDGKRFTIKLRWRKPGGPWSGRMGVSLTGSCDGGDLRLLARATSHVMWDGPDKLYLWQETSKRMMLVEDEAPLGTELDFAPARHIGANVHLRRMQDGFVWDTPYREAIDLIHFDGIHAERIARFDDHRPPTGPFRCDLHPVPFDDGKRILVSSIQDGMRQLYVVET